MMKATVAGGVHFVAGLVQPSSAELASMPGLGCHSPEQLMVRADLSISRDLRVPREHRKYELKSSTFV